MRSGELRITLDTNCLIDLEERRTGYDIIANAIAGAVDRGLSIGVLGISASEKRQKNTAPLGPDELQERLDRHGLGSAEILKPLGFWDVTFWNFCVHGSNETINLHEKIADILFGNSPYRHNEPNQSDHYRRKHRNQLCDCQSIWAHVIYDCDVFVTNDKNFLSKAKTLETVGVKKIIRPIDIVSL